MNKWLVIVAVCSLAVAMPRERRALNEEEVTEAEATAKPPEICAKQTACGWSVYRPITKIVETNITNSYCVCGPGTSCTVNEDDTAINAYVLRCRAASDVEEIIDS